MLWCALSVFCRGEKIHTSVQRMFRIWKERKVYDNGFLRELEQLIGMLDKTIWTCLSTSLDRRVCSLSSFYHSEPPSQKAPAETQVKQHPDFKVCMRAVLMKHLHTQVLIIQQLLLLIMHSLGTAVSAGRCDGGVAQVWRGAEGQVLSPLQPQDRCLQCRKPLQTQR